MSLPQPRHPSGPYRVCLVCLGNICRSPMAEQVLRADLARAGLSGAVAVDSAGTGSWHLGSAMDERAAAVLRAHDYATEHTSRRFEPEWLAQRDLVLAMDARNFADLQYSVTEETAERLRLFRTFAVDAGPQPEVPDPYYGGDGGFDTVLAMVEAASKGLTAQLADLLQDR